MKLIFFLYIMDNHDLYEAHILPFMLLHIKHRRCNNNNNNILFYFISTMRVGVNIFTDVD